MHRPVASGSHPGYPIAIGLALAWVTFGCDLPSAPSFSVEPRLDMPLLSSRTYSVLPSGDPDVRPLIDPSRDALDSLVTDPGDGGAVVVEIPAQTFQFADLGGKVGSLDSDPVSVSVETDGFGNYDLAATTRFEIEPYVLVASDPAVPPALRSSIPVIPLEPGRPIQASLGSPLVLPSDAGDLLVGAQLLAVTLTPESIGANTLVFDLENRLSVESLVSATEPSEPPRLTVLQAGRILGTTRFRRVEPGRIERATISVAGVTLVDSPLSFVLDVSTTSGHAPLQQNPGAALIRSSFLPLHYASVDVAHLPSDNRGLSTRSTIRLEGFPDDVSAVHIGRGSAVFTVENSLPVHVRIGRCEFSTPDSGPVGWPGASITLPAGAIVEAGTRRAFSLDLALQHISRDVAVDCSVSVIATSEVRRFAVGDGIQVYIAGSVEVDQALAVPGIRTMRKSGTILLDSPELRFEPGDYVELRTGILAIERLMNGFPIGFDRVVVAIRGLRRSPFRAEDSITLEFAGERDEPASFRFRAIQPSETRSGIGIDLAGLRLYPEESAIRYDLTADARVPVDGAVIDLDDRFTADLVLRGMTPAAARATATAWEITLTPDRDGDGLSDLDTAGEPSVLGVDVLDEMRKSGLDSLPIRGSRWSIAVTSGIEADFDLYALIRGGEAEPIYLSGRGPFAVSPTDKYALRLGEGGVPAGHEKLIRIPVRRSASGTSIIELDAASASVDEFMEGLPSPITVVALGVVAPSGGRVQVAADAQVSLSLSARVPVRLGGLVHIDHDFGLDAGALADLTDPEKRIRMEHAVLRMDYRNGLPIAGTVAVSFLDDLGGTLLTIPTAGDGFEFHAASVDAQGGAAAAADGSVEIGLTAEQLTVLAGAKQARASVTLRPADREVIVRATDRIRFTVRGDVALRITID